MTFPTSSSNNAEIKIIGLSSQYSTSEPVEITVKIDDSSFDCGDLYVTIYSQTNDVITQGGFFEQCFGTGGKTLPIGDTFSRIIDTPGSYKIVVEMVLKRTFEHFNKWNIYCSIEMDFDMINKKLSLKNKVI